jgi:hypothetical protein
MRLAVLALLVTACAPLASLAQSAAPAPQNPSPMSDTTRPHPRVAQQAPRGQRVAVGGGTLFIREGLRARDTLALIIHFHGAPWLVEHHVASATPDAVLVTFQLGSGSGYAGDASAPRSQDLEVAAHDLDVFLRLAAEAAAGRKRLLVTHAEVYPGTYASTTDMDHLYALGAWLRSLDGLR